MLEMKNHTFVICAYKESKYLEECVKSIINQTVKSNIIMVTATPNNFIKQIADKYNINLYINEGEKGIGQDWNFGVSKTTTDYVTVIHQDDVYKENYLEKLMSYTNKYDDIVMFFTNYKELKNGKVIKQTRNLKIKNLLLTPVKWFSKSRKAKRLSLSFGSPICCPSVTLNTKIVGKKPYKTELKCDLDWDTWLSLTEYKGRYIYEKEVLMYHRIHEESATSKLIENNIRLEEDLEMFGRLWPKNIAKFMMKYYSIAVETNNIDKVKEEK